MGSFRNRLLVLIIGLVVLTQTVTLIAVLARTSRDVEARGYEQLRAEGAVVQQFMRFRATQLASALSVLAADYGFRTAVASGDATTMLSAARNHSTRIGADLLLLLDTDGRLLTSTVPRGSIPSASLAELLVRADNSREQAHFMAFGERLYQVVLAPVRAPDTIGWVLMGFTVDDALANRIRDLVGVDVSLIARSREGGTLVASTHPQRERASLSAQRAAATPDADTPHIVNIGATPYLSFARRLEDGEGSVDVLLLRPMTSVLAPYVDVRNALLLVGSVALILAVAVGLLLGRSATHPIGELVRAARRIASGSYGTAVQTRGGEEFASLAAAFNTMQQDIAEREARITHDAYHDALTGLANRAYAERHLDQLLRSLESTQTALIVLDVRNVREINASLGHHVGDDALREAARRLRQNTGPNELVARLAANQFLVIAGGCSLERAPLLAEQLAGVIRSGFHLPTVSLDLHVTAGVCCAPEHGNSARELLRRAQIALEDAEEARGREALYRAGRDEEHRRRLALVGDLRSAIDNDALTLVYQPKVTVAQRTVTSLEALVRWSHPQLGTISPAEFVPIAERTGASRRLTSWVVNAALRQMAQWMREGLVVDVAVNLSAPDILDPLLSDEILNALRAQRIDATRLVLEITESAVMRDAPLAARNMQLLRIAGVRFSIDDFGTGYSSLSQLSRLPVDELKIDRSFMMHAHERRDDATIVRTTIELGHSMGLKVVAEGVEQPEAWNLLRRLGCDFAQGYLISRPLPAAEVLAFVRQANQLLATSDSTVRQIRALEELASGRS